MGAYSITAVRYENGFRSISFEKISVLDLYFILFNGGI